MNPFRLLLVGLLVMLYAVVSGHLAAYLVTAGILLWLLLIAVWNLW